MVRNRPSAADSAGDGRRIRWWSIPRHCRSCRQGQTRSAGIHPPVRFRPSQAHHRCGRGSCPARCWPSAFRRVSPRRPMHRSWWLRREPRTPTRPRSAAAARPSAHMPRHRDRPPARPDDRPGPQRRCPARTGAASSRPAPRPTIAANRAGRPDPASDETPSRPRPARRGRLRDRERGR
jgi:hypothetical protein